MLPELDSAGATSPAAFANEHPFKDLAVLGLDGCRELVFPLPQRARMQALATAGFKFESRPRANGCLVCKDTTQRPPPVRRPTA